MNRVHNILIILFELIILFRISNQAVDNEKTNKEHCINITPQKEAEFEEIIKKIEGFLIQLAMEHTEIDVRAVTFEIDQHDNDEYQDMETALRFTINDCEQYDDKENAAQKHPKGGSNHIAHKHHDMSIEQVIEEVPTPNPCASEENFYIEPAPNNYESVEDYSSEEYDYMSSIYRRSANKGYQTAAPKSSDTKRSGFIDLARRFLTKINDGRNKYEVKTINDDIGTKMLKLEQSKDLVKKNNQGRRSKDGMIENNNGKQDFLYSNK